MNNGTVEVAATIHAGARRVYSVLADYREGHPAILPKRYFRKLEVVEGGCGAGTKMKVEMVVAGKPVTFIHVATEPDPGKVLVESDASGTTVTTFTVEPTEVDEQCRVRIHTLFPVRRGLAGFFERVVTGMMLRKMYREELAILDAYVRRS